MKRCVLLLGLFLPLFGSAQTVFDEHQRDLLGKGRLNVGISAGQGYKGSRPTTIFYSPKIQYFLADGWSVTLEGRYLKTTSSDYLSSFPFNYAGAGLSTRYYFLRGNRFALFAQVGALYGQSNYDRFEPTDPFSTMNGIHNMNWQTNAGLGAHYRVGRRWSVEATVERSWLPSSYLTPDYNRWQAGIGINYRLK
ncbi:outer membrane beta-barrel protein [Spirosoma utsteinense]|uniref:Outer membrane protein assembly factor BamA n=1 Tax=Spirosoma utsteinense TaxID=2585773 RepID=A0ABR6WG06_9BACT|nr:outer membrane beta-barrel protein [Spirosoma utsteinense]MBC3785682.1 outer membrane protein assembly factor BamA [Spirosoma utsteinense]MBC3795133.1 outer membrane protein assembly factor BamA [Spirosoma utsteinense]